MTHLKLLDAIDALTLPVHVRVTQDIYRTRLTVDGRPVLDDTDQPVRDRKGQQTITVTHPSLLDQLVDAIRGVMDGTNSDNASTSSARVPVNTDALHLHTVIDSQVKDWCRMRGTTLQGSTTGNLRHWYAATLTERWEPTQTDAYTSILHRWAGSIRGVVNPPRILELTEPCPACGSDVWEDGDGTESRHPLQVSYFPDGGDILRTARATCRACDRTWRGSTELRALRWDLDVADTPTPTVDA